MTTRSHDGPPATSSGEPEEHPFQSLYRRYRPQRFAEVRGQDHVTRVLRNSVRDGHVSHAYLFSGPRGTGKTSTARILAKALNCTAPDDGEPCGACESCVAIAAGSSFDVHELDAASNNGVDAMRDLVARSALATPGRFKIYIVDEVHMLSAGASNALLKTLEEPPEHVVFVLATTDPQKVLATIRSRTQHFEFHLLGEDVLAGLLEQVATDAGLDLPDGGLAVALRRGRGSARDALSMLDQVAASGAVEDDSDLLADVVAAIAERDTGGALRALDAMLRSGRDPQQAAVDLVERLRASFLMLVAPGTGGANVLEDGIAEEARALGAPRCVRAMELVGHAITAMRDAPEPRITFEVALVRCTHPEADESVASLLDRLVTLERRIEGLEGGGSPVTMPPLPKEPAVVPKEPAAVLAEPAAVPIEPAAVLAEPAAVPIEPAAVPIEPAAVAIEPAAVAIEPAAVAIEPAAVAKEPAEGRDAGGVERSREGSSRPSLGAFRRRDPAPSGPEPAPPPRTDAAAPIPTAGAAPAPGYAHDAGPTDSVSGVPTRDELVAAWGDRVLTSLRPKVRAYFQAGRFVGTDGPDAVFALPNTVHVAQAEAMRNEVAAALAAHFARPVGLRLVVEGAWGGPGDDVAASPPVESVAERPARREPATRRSTAPAAETEAQHAEGADEPPDFDSVAEHVDEGSEAPDTGLSWAEGRLLQAFPGAEEV